jgi:hypothetical protein
LRLYSGDRVDLLFTAHGNPNQVYARIDNGDWSVSNGTLSVCGTPYAVSPPYGEGVVDIWVVVPINSNHPVETRACYSNWGYLHW